MDDFELLKKIIKRELNIDVDSYRESYLKRRVDSRLRANRVESYSDYIRILGSCAEERKKLESALTIHVTEFFRDHEVWEEIEKIAEELIERRAIVRALSAGCATGEEAYSIAIVFKEATENLRKNCYLKVYGLDIDNDALAIAKKGVYKKIDGHKRWFIRDGEEYRVSDEIKNIVRFERGDITRPLKHNLMDFVLCRNVLIYMDAVTHETVIKSLYNSLSEGGYLVLGMTESLPVSTRTFLRPYNQRLKIYQV